MKSKIEIEVGDHVFLVEGNGALRTISRRGMSLKAKIYYYLDFNDGIIYTAEQLRLATEQELEDISDERFNSRLKG